MKPGFKLCELSEEHFEAALDLCYRVHGENFYTWEELKDEEERSIIGDNCCSFVLYDSSKDKLVGLRITAAPGKWDYTEYTSPSKWGIFPDKVCYFHTVAVDAQYRGLGLGSYLLKSSIEVVKKMGAKAGVAHIWMQSPNNGAYKYFSRNGGQLIKVWENKWKYFHTDARPCPQCGASCSCEAAEMILYFGEQNE